MPDNDPGFLFGLYRQMLLIRRFEERCNELFLQGRIPSTLHLYIGQEAVAVGVCSALRRDDQLFSTHRPHGHALAKGVTAKSIMAELMAKATGCCKGKGGSMHVGDVAVGMPPSIAIVGAGAPIAVGAALAARMRGTDAVAVCFFGDGGANEGAVHEAMNMAAIWKTPAIFVCENNLYGASTPVDQVIGGGSIARRADAYGMPGLVTDGNDVMAVRETLGEAVARARRGEGPSLVECLTYRLCGHSRSDACNYRTREEEAVWRDRDPLLVFERRFASEQGPLGSGDISRAGAEVEQEIKEAVDFALESPEPKPEEALLHVFWEAR